jgi:hypothetical protein
MLKPGNSVNRSAQLSTFNAKTEGVAPSGFFLLAPSYEPPLAPEIVIEGASSSAEDNADRIIAHLLERRFILPTFN